MEEIRQFWDTYGWMVAVGWFIGFIILMAFLEEYQGKIRTQCFRASQLCKVCVADKSLY